MEINILLGLLSATATLTCAFLGALLHRKTEKIKIMEGQLSEKRYSAYAKLYDFFYEVFKETIDGKNVNERIMKNKLLDAKKELIMYGTDDVVFALNKYLASLTDVDLSAQIDNFLDIMLLIRKDMCGKSKVNRDDIMLNIIQDKNEMQKYKDLKKQYRLI